MEVKIRFLPNKTSDIDYAKQVKNIATDLVKMCAECGVINLTYSHDYFEIQISKRILFKDKGDK